MQQWQLHPLRSSSGIGQQSSSANELRLLDVERPRLGPGQVRVKLRAASLNFRDLLILRGEVPCEAGRVPLSDGAGEIMELGPGARAWKEGDRVAWIMCWK